MSKTRTLQKSFIGGVMSPAMHARVVDDIRAQNGFGAGTRNMQVLPNGGAMRRRGFRHVAHTKLGSTKTSVLRRFDLSGSLSLQVEIGEKHFRFHQFGAPMRWATPRVVDLNGTGVSDMIKFTEAHGLAVNDEVQFIHSSGNDANLPGVLVASVTYFVHTVVDPKSIKVKATIGGGVQAVADAGTATSYLYKSVEVPKYYFVSRNFLEAAVDIGANNWIDLTTAHNFATGDPVQFTSDTQLPTYFDGVGSVFIGPGVTFFIIVVDSTHIRLALTRDLAFAGTAVDFNSDGTGTHTIHRVYSTGDLIYWQGSGHGVFYCLDEVAQNVAPPSDTPHWYLQGRDGVYEIPHPYVESEIASITLSQDNDTLVLAHRGTARTFQTTGDTDVSVADNEITETGHGMLNGTIITVATNISFPGGLAANTNYYVVKAQTNTFRLSLTQGGTEVDITADAPAGTTLTWTWYPRSPTQLRRHDALKWIYSPVAFAPTLPPPVAVHPVTREFGEYVTLDGDNAVPTLFTSLGSQNNGHGFLSGDSVYVEKSGGGAVIGGGSSFGPGPGAVPYPAGFYEIAKIGQVALGTPFNDCILRTLNGGAEVTNVNDNVFMRRVDDPLTEIVHDYRVTAVDVEGRESLTSNTASANGNNLTVSGASNTIFWSAVPGAVRYHIYRKKNRLYGLIGVVDALQSQEFKDENLTVDLSKTLPIFDTTLGVSAGDRPGAVADFDQRRFFGGTFNFQNRIWGTRVAADTDLCFHIPLQDDDRLRFSLKTQHAVSILHLVPLKRLVVLTDASEVQIVPVNSQVLTPTTIEARTASNEGSTIVRPIVLSGNILFAAARGGHLLEIGETPNGELSKPGSLCLRAEHLFESSTLLDQTDMKAPYQLSWCASSSGLLLGLTYIPQEQVGAWHAHETAGFFESVSAGAEGDEDALYAIVRRTINGQTVRSVERMAEKRFTRLDDAYFVDAGGSFDFTNTTATTITLSESQNWLKGESVKITASAMTFITNGTDDVGDHICVRASQTGSYFRVKITSVTSTTVAMGVLLESIPAASGIRNTAKATWAFARDTIRVPHLEAQTVQILGDALVQPTKTVASGLITLTTPAITGHVGLACPAPLELLPAALQAVEAAGQDREVNVAKAHLRLLDACNFKIGPSLDAMVPSKLQADPGKMLTRKVDIALLGTWQPDTTVFLLVEDPVPFTVLGTVLEVSVGGG